MINNKHVLHLKDGFDAYAGFVGRRAAPLYAAYGGLKPHYSKQISNFKNAGYSLVYGDEHMGQLGPVSSITTSADGYDINGPSLLSKVGMQEVVPPSPNAAYGDGTQGADQMASAFVGDRQDVAETRNVIEKPSDLIDWYEKQKKLDKAPPKPRAPRKPRVPKSTLQTYGPTHADLLVIPSDDVVTVLDPVRSHMGKKSSRAARKEAGIPEKNKSTSRVNEKLIQQVKDHNAQKNTTKKDSSKNRQYTVFNLN